MAGTTGGRGAQGQFFPDAQGNYHTGNQFFDQQYKALDAQQKVFDQDPRVQALIKSGGSGTVNKVIGDTDVKVERGVITHTATGGVWKPIIAAGVIAATAGVAGAAMAPAAAAPALAGGAASGGAAAGSIGSFGAISGAGVVGSGGASAGIGAGLAGAATRYGIPLAGNLVSQYIQNRANSQASAAEQDYLKEALAYQKEQDAFNRTRQTGLDSKDDDRYAATTKTDADRYAYSTGVDAARYGDTQQTQLADFARNENRYAYTTDLETSRYADYSKRIAPYLASGANANDRMASLLGLPKGAAFDPTLTAGPKRVVSAPPVLSAPGSGFGGGSGPSPSQRKALDPATEAAIDAQLKTLNSSDDASYWKEKLAAHGDSLTNNWKYWADFMARGDGVNKGYRG